MPLSWKKGAAGAKSEIKNKKFPTGTTGHFVELIRRCYCFANFSPCEKSRREWECGHQPNKNCPRLCCWLCTGRSRVRCRWFRPDTAPRSSWGRPRGTSSFWCTWRREQKRVRPEMSVQMLCGSSTWSFLHPSAPAAQGWCDWRFAPDKRTSQHRGSKQVLKALLLSHPKLHLVAPIKTPNLNEVNVVHPDFSPRISWFWPWWSRTLSRSPDCTGQSAKEIGDRIYIMVYVPLLSVLDASSLVISK